MTTFISIMHGAGAFSWRDPVLNADLATLAGLNHVRLVSDTGELRYYNGSSWELVGAAPGGSIEITDLAAEVAGQAAAVGEIGEILTASQGAATATNRATTGVWGYATSIALTAGAWEIDGVVGFSENGALLTTSVSAGISNTADGSGLATFDFLQHNSQIGSSSDLIIPLPKILINIAAGDTYYLNTRFYFSSGSPEHYGKIVARRYR